MRLRFQLPTVVLLKTLGFRDVFLEAFLPLQCRPTKETFLSCFAVVIHPEPGSSLTLSFLLRFWLPSCIFPQGLTTTTVCCDCCHACCLHTVVKPCYLITIGILIRSLALSYYGFWEDDETFWVYCALNKLRLHAWKCCSKSFKNVTEFKKYKYFGLTVINQNCTHGEVNSRINSGNFVFCLAFC